jgi:CHAT domain-containing protein
LRRLCSNPRSSRKAIRGLEEELWRSIFADPLRKHPELRGLRIESTGVLNSLPLAAIFADLAPALLENGSSLTPYPVAAEDAHNSKWTLIVGSTIDRQLAVSLPVLSDLEDEVRSVAGEMASRSAPAEILRGVEATPAALARSAAHARVLHFAGHAIHWRDGVALVASPDPDERDQDRRMGIWRISADSPIPAELAVFSACSTADLEENETAKPERLSEAALLAGARNVIGTLWDVDSAAAARFNALFYRYWKQGMRIEQAVGAAALSLRASTEFSHPYYWAPFALFQAPPQRRNN